jgi:hypothetical protein
MPNMRKVKPKGGGHSQKCGAFNPKPSCFRIKGPTFSNAPTQGRYAYHKVLGTMCFIFLFLVSKFRQISIKTKTKKGLIFTKKNPKSYQFLC